MAVTVRDYIINLGTKEVDEKLSREKKEGRKVD